MRDEKQLFEKLLNKIMRQFVLKLLNDNSLISVKTNQSRRLDFWLPFLLLIRVLSSIGFSKRKIDKTSPSQNIAKN